MNKHLIQKQNRVGKQLNFGQKMIVQLVGVLALLGVFTPENADNIIKGIIMITSGLSIALPEVAYSISRGMTKKK